MNTYLIKVVFCPESAYHQCVLDLAAGVGDTTGQGAGVIPPLTGTVVVLVLVPVPVRVHSTASKLSKKKQGNVIQQEVRQNCTTVDSLLNA